MIIDSAMSYVKRSATKYNVTLPLYNGYQMVTSASSTGVWRPSSSFSSSTELRHPVCDHRRRLTGRSQRGCRKAEKARRKATGGATRRQRNGLGRAREQTRSNAGRKKLPYAQRSEGAELSHSAVTININYQRLQYRFFNFGFFNRGIQYATTVAASSLPKYPSASLSSSGWLL